MKASEVAIPKDALAEAWSPRSSATYDEYAVEVGGSVLGKKRYRTAEDAYFWGCVLGNAKDRETYGRVMVKRRVVKRKVTFGEWEKVKMK